MELSEWCVWAAHSQIEWRREARYRISVSASRLRWRFGHGAPSNGINASQSLIQFATIEQYKTSHGGGVGTCPRQTTGTSTVHGNVRLRLVQLHGLSSIFQSPLRVSAVQLGATTEKDYSQRLLRVRSIYHLVYGVCGEVPFLDVMWRSGISGSGTVRRMRRERRFIGAGGCRCLGLVVVPQSVRCGSDVSRSAIANLDGRRRKIPQNGSTGLVAVSCRR